MLLFSNILYHFAFAKQRNHSQSDPEKGTDANPINFDGNGTQGPPLTDENHTNLPNNDPQTDDDFVPNHHSEKGELQPAEDIWSARERRFPLLDTGSMSPSACWTRLKNWLNPYTSIDDLESYAPHYRYMPILSGIIIPFSILLEIPGLTEHWYIRTQDHKIVETRQNTTVLDVGLGFSIGFAALANLALIGRFLERKVKTMTFLCILFLTIHDVINIITVIIFGVEHRFDDGFTYGPAFWMTVCSTSVSSITNVTLVMDYLRTPNFSTSGSGLTRKQRTLVISVMTLLTYVAFGALVQTYLVDLSFIDALYFTVVSIETIGFGDIVPTTTGSRVFTCIYSILGILTLALTVGLTRETVLEGLEIGYIQRVRELRQRRRQQEFEHRVDQRWTNAIEWRLRRAGKPVWVPDVTQDQEQQQQPRSGRFWWNQKFKQLRHNLMKLFRGVGSKVNDLRHGRGYGHPHGMRLNLEGLKWSQLEAAAMEAGVPLHTLLPPDFHMQDGEQEEDWWPPNHARPHREREAEKGEHLRAPLTHARLGRMIAMLGKFALAVDASSFAVVPERKGKRREQGIASGPAFIDVDVDKDEHGFRRTITENNDSLRASMEHEELKAFYVRLAVVWVVFILFWMVGSVIFMATEKWTFGIALYFCFISFTTIGYGDYSPVTPAGRSIFVFWALLGVATMTILISTISDRYSSRYKGIFRSGEATAAVKRYQERARAGMILNSSTSPSYTLVPGRGPDTGSTYVQAVSSSSDSPTSLQSPIHIDKALSESHKRVIKHLEALPTKVLRHAKTFGEDAEYLMKSELLEHGKTEVPDGLKKLMENVAGVERFSETIKKEILRDTDARHALLAISIGDALQKIIESAEEVAEALKERDRLDGLKSPTHNNDLLIDR